jgi:hypothetical protein
MWEWTREASGAKTSLRFRKIERPRLQTPSSRGRVPSPFRLAVARKAYGVFLPCNFGSTPHLQRTHQRKGSVEIWPLPCVVRGQPGHRPPVTGPAPALSMHTLTKRKLSRHKEYENSTATSKICQARYSNLFTHCCVTKRSFMRRYIHHSVRDASKALS